jgi:hypothetical protein
MMQWVAGEMFLAIDFIFGFTGIAIAIPSGLEAIRRPTGMGGEVSAAAEPTRG